MSRMTAYDRFFPRSGLLDAYSRTLAGMGLETGLRGNIHVDIEARPAKDPRPCCYVPDPPDEVHLVIKPRGGLEDYAALMHEAGHAQHYGNVSATLDYVFRAVPTSYALTEVYAFLFQNLLQNEKWLRDIAGLPGGAAREVLWRVKLADLLFLRRYAALFDYESRFYEDPQNELRNRALYAERLSSATGFLYPHQRYLSDLDDNYYCADYLRAWISEAMLRRHLEDTFGEGWFTRPEAGALLLNLWSRGESIGCEDISRMLGYRPFDTTRLAEQYGLLGTAWPER